MHNFDYMEDTLDFSQKIIDDEGSLNYGPLSLCKIKRLVSDMYQVDCMYHKINYTNLFQDFSVAFNKFIELKEALILNGYKVNHV